MNTNIICHLTELVSMPKNIKSFMGLIHGRIQAKLNVLGSTATKAAPWLEKAFPMLAAVEGIPQPPLS